MWNVPPAGCRRSSAVTTLDVSFSTCSRIAADAAPAMKALVIATAIFDGSNATTAPLRRMTL